jgi:LPXTG-motif cell wall-anchored protein
MSPIRRFTAFAAVVPIALLAGCGWTPIMSANGEGTCEGKGDFSITTTQNADASNYTVSYDGPDDVSLIVSQGFYVDYFDELDAVSPDFFGNELFFSLTDFGDSLIQNMHVYRIDPTNDGWTTTGSGANTHHEFSGPFGLLIDGQPLGASLSDGGTPLDDTYMPGIVGVVCTDAVTTGFYYESDPEAGYVDSIEIEAAAHIEPNHLLLDPMVIDTSVDAPGGRTGTAHFPASNAVIFGDFVPTDVRVDGAIGADIAEVPNDSFSNLWFNAIAGDQGDGLSLSFPEGISANGSFDWVLDVGPNATTGNYIALLFLDGTDETGDTRRVAFMNLYFDADSGGVAFLDPIGTPVNPDLSELADTGVDAESIGLVAGGLLVAGAAVAALSIGRRRRK